MVKSAEKEKSCHYIHDGTKHWDVGWKKIGVFINEHISMECSSMVSIASFDSGDPGSNPRWFTVSNSNRKLSFQE